MDPEEKEVLSLTMFPPNVHHVRSASLEQCPVVPCLAADGTKTRGGSDAADHGTDKPREKRGTFQRQRSGSVPPPATMCSTQTAAVQEDQKKSPVPTTTTSGKKSSIFFARQRTLFTPPPSWSSASDGHNAEVGEGNRTSSVVDLTSTPFGGGGGGGNGDKGSGGTGGGGGRNSWKHKANRWHWLWSHNRGKDQIRQSSSKHHEDESASSSSSGNHPSSAPSHHHHHNLWARRRKGASSQEQQKQASFNVSCPDISSSSSSSDSSSASSPPSLPQPPPQPKTATSTAFLAGRRPEIDRGFGLFDSGSDFDLNHFGIGCGGSFGSSTVTLMPSPAEQRCCEKASFRACNWIDKFAGRKLCFRKRNFVPGLRAISLVVRVCVLGARA